MIRHLCVVVSVLAVAGCNGAASAPAIKTASTSTSTSSPAAPVTTNAAPWAPATGSAPVAATLAIDPSDAQRVLVGGLGSFAVSSDGGSTWSDLRALVNFPAASSTLWGSIDTIAFDPTSPKTIYAGARTPDAHLWRSHDSGTTWSEVPVGFSNDVDGLAAIVVDPSAPNTIYVGAQLVIVQPGTVRSSQIWKTTDGGATWVTLDPPMPWLVALAIDPRTTSTLYAAGSDDGSTTTRGGLFKSTDGGVTWTAIGTSFFEPTAFVNTGLPSRAIAIDPKNPSTLYTAGYKNGSTAGQLAKSTDGGATWSALDTGVQADDFVSVVLDPATPSTVYAVGTSSTAQVLALKSTDGGKTFFAIEGGLVASSTDMPPEIAVAASAPATLYLALPTEPALFVTKTGGQ